MPKRERGPNKSQSFVVIVLIFGRQTGYYGWYNMLVLIADATPSHCWRAEQRWRGEVGAAV
jgi:hypothetical protein